MWFEFIVILYLLGSLRPSISAFQNCAPEKQCVPYEQCNEGLTVDGKFYPDRSRTTLDEKCHYMEKCCNTQDTVSTVLNKKQKKEIEEIQCCLLNLITKSIPISFLLFVLLNP